MANLSIIEVISVNFFFYETSGKVHGNFHVPFTKHKARYMEISMYLVTEHMAKYMEISVYLATKHMARYVEISMYLATKHMEK